MKLYKIVLLCCAILVLVPFVSSAEQISEYEASSIGTSYAYNGEICEAHGPYEYNKQMYYVCVFYTANDVTGEIVIDTNNGNIVEDAIITKSLIKNDLALRYLNTEESYTTNLETASVLRDNIAIFEDDYNFWVDIKNSAPTAEQKDNSEEAITISKTLISNSEKLLENTEKYISIQKSIRRYGTTDDAIALIEVEKEGYYLRKSILKDNEYAIDQFTIIYDK